MKGNENNEFTKHEQLAHHLHRIFLSGDIPQILQGDNEFKTPLMEEDLKKFGITLQFKIQKKTEGIAQTF